MEPESLGILTALWLGILTSISPCPLATNIAAISYVGRQVGSTRGVLLAGLLYTAGRTIAYVLLGATAVWGLMSMVTVSSFLQGVVHRALGPFLIVVGFLLLGVVKLNFSGVGVNDRLQKRIDKLGVWGGGLLGFVFAISFCPVSAGLFFGSLVPLAADTGSPIVMPLAYGIGTGLPVFGFSLLLAVGASRASHTIQRVQGFERWARRITAVIIIGVGVYETLRSTLYLI